MSSMASQQPLQQVVDLRVVCDSLGSRLRLGISWVKAREMLSLSSTLGVGGNVCSLASGIPIPVRLLRWRDPAWDLFRCEVRLSGGEVLAVTNLVCSLEWVASPLSQQYYIVKCA